MSLVISVQFLVAVIHAINVALTTTNGIRPETEWALEIKPILYPRRDPCRRGLIESFSKLPFVHDVPILWLVEDYSQYAGTNLFSPVPFSMLLQHLNTPVTSGS